MQARELAQQLIIVDGHVDLPYRLAATRDAAGRVTEDVCERTGRGDFDYPRAVEGGVDAAFMSIYVPASMQRRGSARAVADDRIDIVEELLATAPGKFAPARSPAEVRRNAAAGLISLPLGIENGAALEGDLDNVEHFFARGVRYITLTHSQNNDICDSSYAGTRRWNGLSRFGAEVVAEMNRIGIMVDVAHVSDAAFDHVLALSSAPIIASHSSCRHFTPGFERNLDDDMIRRLADAGGVVMINYGSTFVSADARRYFTERRISFDSFLSKTGAAADSVEAQLFRAAYENEHPPIRASVADVAAHVDHVARLVGTDHVGLGSDFEGVGDTLPTGLRDVSQVPNLLRELVERGYGEGDLEKICSGNIFRVWDATLARAGGVATGTPA